MGNPGRVDVIGSVGDLDLVATVDADHKEVGVLVSASVVDDRAAVRRPGEGGPLCPRGSVAGYSVVVVTVRVDHVDALTVRPAVEDPVASRRPHLSVLGVGMADDDVIAGYIG